MFTVYVSLSSSVFSVMSRLVAPSSLKTSLRASAHSITVLSVRSSDFDVEVVWELSSPAVVADSEAEAVRAGVPPFATLTAGETGAVGGVILPALPSK